jgi:hypothetical protein
LYNELVTGKDNQKNKLSVVLLIHPIGVGIARWYDRLLAVLAERSTDDRYHFLVPDLLASGSACQPRFHANKKVSDPRSLKKLPLFSTLDWSKQMEHFMENLKQIANKTYGSDRVRWILVANGGCAPIAINVAACSNLNISNVVLSSTPSLQSLLTASDRKKVEKTYHRILSGVAGKLFWWYALRNNGTFIQKYSQRNLMANLDSMGEDWTANCVSHARLHNGMSRFSTFAFLAGALKCDCQKQFNLLKNHEINIDIISGKNRRHRSARR